MKLFEDRFRSPKASGLRHIETHFRRRVALLDQDFEPMDRYEQDAKRIFESQFEKSLTRQQAVQLAGRIIDGYQQQARNYNKTRTEGPHCLETMPETLAFQNERAVRQLFWHKKAAEQDRDALYKMMDGFEDRMKNENNVQKVKDAHQEARKHEAYVRLVIEEIEKRHYETAEPDPTLTNEDRDLATRLEFGENPFAGLIVRHPVLWKLLSPIGNIKGMTRADRVDLVNRIIIDPTGKSRFARPVYGRDLHPQWYIGERERSQPHIVAQAEMLRAYQTGKFLVEPTDFHKLQDRWVAFRMTHLKQMASRYRQLKQGLEKQLKRMQ